MIRLAMKTKVIISSGVALMGAIVAAGVWAVERLPDQCAFCSRCAALEITSRWTVSGIPKSLVETHRVMDTSYSSLLVAKKIVSPHEHHWLVPEEVPDPVNEFGPKVTESLEFINTPRVVSFMRNLADYGNPEMIEHWNHTILDPKYSHVLDTSLVYVNAPATGFHNGSEFRDWFQNNSAAFQARLSWLTTAD